GSIWPAGVKLDTAAAAAPAAVGAPLECEVPLDSAAAHTLFPTASSEFIEAMSARHNRKSEDAELDDETITTPTADVFPDWMVHGAVGDDGPNSPLNKRRAISHAIASLFASRAF